MVLHLETTGITCHSHVNTLWLGLPLYVTKDTVTQCEVVEDKWTRLQVSMLTV